jgi:hypothetical protein
MKRKEPHQIDLEESISDSHKRCDTVAKLVAALRQVIDEACDERPAWAKSDRRQGSSRHRLQHHSVKYLVRKVRAIFRRRRRSPVEQPKVRITLWWN